jgi:hypothetical protein
VIAGGEKAMKVQSVKVSKSERRPNRLGSVLERRLVAYAAAAGVGCLAAPEAAEAKVVYTPAETVILFPSTVPIDLNHDGIADFSFVNYGGSGCCGEFGRSLQLQPIDRSNRMWGQAGGTNAVFVFPSALHSGITIRQNQSHLQQGSGLMAFLGVGSVNSRTYGQWFYARDRYLGLSFVINGEIHYGWARVNVSLGKFSERVQWGVVAVLTGYAYETIPNKPIVTGKTKGPDVITLAPDTLGHLAQGAAGISGWRRK